MSNQTSRLMLSGLSAILLVSCSAAPVAQVTNPVKPTVTTPAVTTPAAVTPPSQEQLKNLQVKLMDDDNFAASFEKDPRASLKAQGISLPDSEQVKVLQVGSKMFMVLDDRNLQTFHASLLSQAADNKSDLQKLLDVIRGKASNDAAFKAQLLSNTFETLKAEGVDETIAKQLEVIDYQPNTSLLMVAPLGTEINRGVGDEILKFFNGLPDKLAPALQTAIDKVTSFVAGAERKISKAAISSAADGLVTASNVVCFATAGVLKFSCDDTKGKSKTYWVNGITNYLLAQKYLIEESVEAIINRINTAIAHVKSQILNNDNEIRTIQEQLDKLKNAVSETDKKMKNDLQQKLQSLLALKAQLDMQLSLLLKQLASL